MDLSVVIATYEMRREAPRTIRSALAPLQAKISGIEYEICVIDNGSPNGSASFDDIEFGSVPLHHICVPPDEASPSPAPEINRVVSERATGEYVLVCIDGARMLSKQLIGRAFRTVSKVPHAAAFAQTRHLGSIKQSKAVLQGYDQDAEDELLASCNWQEDLDALFDISVYGGCHDLRWRILQYETGAIAMSRSDWIELGGFDEGFARPGGGLCNIEFFRRMVDHPNMVPILLAGEATFHQFHGGAATSNKNYAADSRSEYKKVTGTELARNEIRYLVDFDTEQERIERSGVRF